MDVGEEVKVEEITEILQWNLLRLTRKHNFVVLLSRNLSNLCHRV